MRLTTLCKRGWGLVHPRTPIPEPPAPASRSVYDSYVSKGGPWVGVGASATSATWAWVQFEKLVGFRFRVSRYRLGKEF